MVLKKFENHIKYLSFNKKEFLGQQRKKIDELHAYLEDRFLDVVCQYNIAQEQDIVDTKNKMDSTTKFIEENKKYV